MLESQRSKFESRYNPAFWETYEAKEVLTFPCMVKILDYDQLWLNMTRGQIAKMIKKSKNHFAKWCHNNRRQSDRSENISLRNPTLSVRCLSLSLSPSLLHPRKEGEGVAPSAPRRNPPSTKKLFWHRFVVSRRSVVEVKSQKNLVFNFFWPKKWISRLRSISRTCTFSRQTFLKQCKNKKLQTSLRWIAANLSEKTHFVLIFCKKKYQDERIGFQGKKFF